MAYTFDGPNTTIFLSPGTVVLDVRDMYSRWKEWVQLSDNSKFLPAFSSVGGDPIDQLAGTFVPAYIYLINGWHVHTQQANHTLNVIGGVLLVEGGGDPFEDVPGYTIRINYQQPVQAITVASGSGLSPSQTAQLDEIHKLHGLDASNPLVVSPTSRQVGTISQTISDASGTVTVSRAP